MFVPFVIHIEMMTDSFSLLLLFLLVMPVMWRRTIQLLLTIVLIIVAVLVICIFHFDASIRFVFKL